MGTPSPAPFPRRSPAGILGGWPTTAVPFPRWSPTEILGNSTPRGGSVGMQMPGPGPDRFPGQSPRPGTGIRTRRPPRTSIHAHTCRRPPSCHSRCRHLDQNGPLLGYRLGTHGAELVPLDRDWIPARGWIPGGLGMDAQHEEETWCRPPPGKTGRLCPVYATTPLCLHTRGRAAPGLP